MCCSGPLVAHVRFPSTRVLLLTTLPLHLNDRRLLSTLPHMQGRMADSNRNLAAKVLVLLGDIAKAMGPAFDKGARPVVLAPAVANLADNKKQVQGNESERLGLTAGRQGQVGARRLR